MKFAKGFLLGVGIYQAGSSLLPFGCTLKAYYLTRNKELADIYGHGSVLITGGTQGLGYELAKEAASRGLNVILMSRSEERMKNVKEEIESKYKVKMDFIVYDFSKPNLKGLSQLKDKSVSMLINNVGFLDNNDVSLKTLKGMIDINCHSYQSVLHTLLPSLKQQGLGQKAIVNIGSQKAEREDDAPSLYFATKKNCNNFAKAIKIETQNPNLKNFLVMPGIMKTPMLEGYAKGFANSFKGGLLSDEPTYIAKRAFDMISRGYSVNYGTERHSFLRIWFENFYPFIWTWSKGMDMIYSTSK